MDVSQGRGRTRTIALGGTLLVHVALGVWLSRLTADDAPATRPDPALQVVWVDASIPPSSDAPAAPLSPRRTPTAPGVAPRPPPRRAPALQAVDVASPAAADAPPSRPSLQDQARALARSAAPVGGFDPDPLRHRPPPRADGRFAMRDPLSAQDVVNGIGALFGGGPSDPCPRIRQHLANADMGAGRALAAEELERLRRHCL